MYMYVYEYAYVCIVTMQRGLVACCDWASAHNLASECGHDCFAPGLVDVNSKDASTQH